MQFCYGAFILKSKWSEVGEKPAKFQPSGGKVRGVTGTYEHSIDAKGRLFIPAKLREELGVTFYLAKIGRAHV